jgi:hypothetical protein
VSDSEEFPPVFIVSDRAAVGGHLETAITLWFEEKDASSIHTLAVAAQGALNQMCKEKGIRASQINQSVEALKEDIRNAMRAPQNFFKHGRYTGQKVKGKVVNTPMWTELILVDCLSMHTRLFGTLSPMMLLYAFRYSLFNPRAFPTKITVKGIKIEDLRRFSRREFLEKVFPSLRSKIGDLSAHLGKPPKWTELP